MPLIKVESPSPFTAQETFQRIGRLLDQDTDLRKIDPHYDCVLQKDLLTGTVSSSQFSAKLKVLTLNAGSHVEIVVDLPFHLTLIKSTISATLKRKLSEALT